MLWSSILILIMILGQGCASMHNPTNEVRVTEYTGTAEPGIAGTVYVDGQLDVTGCRIVVEGVVPGTVDYRGIKCRFTLKPTKSPIMY